EELDGAPLDVGLVPHKDVESAELDGLGVRTKGQEIGQLQVLEEHPFITTNRSLAGTNRRPRDRRYPRIGRAARQMSGAARRSAPRELFAAGAAEPTLRGSRSTLWGIEVDPPWIEVAPG